MHNRTTIDIKTTTILKIIGILLGVCFLWYIRQVLIILFVVAILSAAFSPIVEKLYKQKVPRFLSVLLIYLGLAAFVSLVIYLIIPPVAYQIRQLTFNLPDFVERITPLYGQSGDYLPLIQRNLQSIVATLNQYTASLWLSLANLFGGIISFLTILVLTFYFLVGRETVKEAVVSFLPLDYREKTIRMAKKIGVKMGGWLRGQFILCLLVGLASYIVLVILGIPYALVLAVLAGILEIVPTLGPIIAAVPAVFFAFLSSPISALIVALAYIGIQQLESQIVVPKLMGKIVGLSPIIIIIALLIGAKLLGIVGAILAIPAAAAIQVLIQETKA